MDNYFANIDNNELQEILKYVEEEPIFFYDEMRLLSKEEIINYKEELNVEMDNIIPLIDLYDNDFLVYNIAENVFGKLSIDDETFFERTNSIENYLKLLREYKWKFSFKKA